MKTDSIRVHVFFRIINILKRLKYLTNIFTFCIEYNLLFILCIIYRLFLSEYFQQSTIKLA